MNNKLKETFDNIHAEAELKDKTKEFLALKTKSYIKTTPFHYRPLLTAAACLLFLFAGGHWLYFTPTAEIGIDINPSIELSINRFDKVVSVNGYNDDGKELARTLNLKYENYEDAVDQVLKNESVASLLADNAIMTISVVGPENGEQTAKILSDMESCTLEHKNTHCYFASSEEADAAHETGLSHGKYKAFLELQALGSDITPEEIRNMTMNEIKTLIDDLSDNNGQISPTDGSEESSHHGSGEKHRYRKNKTAN